LAQSLVGPVVQSNHAALLSIVQNVHLFSYGAPPSLSRARSRAERRAVQSIYSVLLVTDKSATLRPIAFPIATMKRKLDKNNEPSSPVQSDKETIEAQKEPVQAVEENQKSRAEPSFAELGLDPRLVQAIAKQNFEKPTLVQRKAIPLALKGQDVLCKAKTGSGKTAAYVLPVLSGILKRKTVGSPSYRSRVSIYRLETDPASILDRSSPFHLRIDLGTDPRACRPSL